MLTNEQMKAGRFLRWQQAKRKVSWIVGHLEAGREVYICTYTKATRYTKKHIGMFKATKAGAYVQHGSKFVCFDFAKVEAR